MSIASPIHWLCGDKVDISHHSHNSKTTNLPFDFRWNILKGIVLLHSDFIVLLSMFEEYASQEVKMVGFVDRKDKFLCLYGFFFFGSGFSLGHFLDFRIDCQRNRKCMLVLRVPRRRRQRHAGVYHTRLQSYIFFYLRYFWGPCQQLPKEWNMSNTSWDG